jgi:hypothetical protein
MLIIDILTIDMLITDMLITITNIPITDILIHNILITDMLITDMLISDILIADILIIDILIADIGANVGTHPAQSAQSTTLNTPSTTQTAPGLNDTMTSSTLHHQQSSNSPVSAPVQIVLQTSPLDRQLLARQPQLQVSVHASVASLFRCLQPRSDIWVGRGIDPQSVQIDYLELTFKDQVQLSFMLLY